MKRRTAGEKLIGIDFDKVDGSLEVTHLKHTVAMLINFLEDNAAREAMKRLAVSNLVEAARLGAQSLEPPKTLRGFEDND